MLLEKLVPKFLFFCMMALNKNIYWNGTVFLSVFLCEACQVKMPVIKQRTVDSFQLEIFRSNQSKGHNQVMNNEPFCDRCNKNTVYCN